jgi:hypothetical protein
MFPPLEERRSVFMLRHSELPTIFSIMVDLVVLWTLFVLHNMVKYYSSIAI